MLSKMQQLKKNQPRTKNFYLCIYDYIKHNSKLPSADDLGLENMKKDGRITPINPFHKRIENSNINYCFSCGNPISNFERICPHCKTKLK